MARGEVVRYPARRIEGSMGTKRPQQGRRLWSAAAILALAGASASCSGGDESVTTGGDVVTDSKVSTTGGDVVTDSKVSTTSAGVDVTDSPMVVSGEDGGTGEVLAVIAVQDEEVVAHDPASGSVMWRAEGEVDPEDRLFAFGDAGVFVQELDDVMVGIDLRSGELLWRNQLEDELAYAAAAAGSLITHSRSTDRVSSWAVTSGEEQWFFEEEGLDGLYVAEDAQRVVAVIEGELRGTIVLLDAADGSELWRVPEPASLGYRNEYADVSEGVVAAPGPFLGRALVDGEQVVLSRGGGEVEILDGGDGALLWELDGEDAVVAWQDTIVTFRFDNLRGFDRRSGQDSWQVDVDLTEGSEESLSIVQDDGLVFVAGETNGLVAVDMSTGAVQWSLDGKFGDLSVANPVIVAAVDDRVVALDPQTGATMWSGEPGSGDLDVMTLRDRASGVLLATDNSGETFLGIAASSGEILWTVEEEAWFP
jgi:outer membrane protein assembly factor BamB